jgi:predicted membrane-bound mannosyltransferase
VWRKQQTCVRSSGVTTRLARRCCHTRRHAMPCVHYSKDSSWQDSSRRDIAWAALSAEAGGNHAAARIISAAVDDWCGTGRPRIPIPWPSPWPLPWALEAEPHREWDIAAPRVVGALSFAAVAARISDGAVREALAKAAEQLLEVALG